MTFEEIKILISVGLVWTGWTFYKVILEPKIKQVIDFLKNKNKYEAKGAKISRGIIL